MLSKSNLLKDIVDAKGKSMLMTATMMTKMTKMMTSINRLKTKKNLK